MKSNTLFLDQYSFKLLIDELHLNRKYNQKAMRKPDEVILTFQGVCETLQVDDKTLRKWCEQGKIIYSKVDNSRFFTLDAVLAFIKRNKV